MRIHFHLPRSYAEVARSAPTHPPSAPLRPVPSILRSLPPPIYNLEAQRLAKRRKSLDTSGEGIFNALHQCLKKYSQKTELTFEENEETTRVFKKANPELFRWILQNGPDAREKTAIHGLERNKHLAGKVKELLYWIPLTASQKDPLHPETVCALVRKHLLLGYTPKEIAEELTSQGNFPFELAKLTWLTLEKAATLFVKVDSPYIKDSCPLTFRHLYLTALDQTELFYLMSDFGFNRGGALTKLLDLSDPSTWSGMLKRAVSSWKEVGDFFDNSLSEELTQKDLRNWMTKLKELESALSLIEEPRMSQLLFLAWEGDYPNCQRVFPILFDQLRACKREFPLERIVNAVHKCYRESCPPPKREEPKKDRDHFCSTFSMAIYQASYSILYHLFQNSQENVPPELKNAIQQALNGTPDRFEEDLQRALAKKTPESEQFFYSLSTFYFEKDLIEWMQWLIGCLSEDDFHLLANEMVAISKEIGNELDPKKAEQLLERYPLCLQKHIEFKLNLQFEDLPSMKMKIDQYPGDPL